VARFLEGIRAVVFDLDDTLINWREAEGQAIDGMARDCLAGAGVPVERAAAAYRGVMEANWEAYFRDGTWMPIGERLAQLKLRLGLDGQVATVEMMESFTAHVHASLRLLPGAQEAIAAVRASGRRTALLTNGPARVQRPKVAQFKLDAAVDFVGITGELGHWKPSPRAFTAVLDKLEVPPEQAVMVGDSLLFDIKPAKLLGMRTCWVAPGGTDPSADAVVPAPGGLLALAGLGP
jgi:putative hydrolase of the HAD superfamily